MKRIVLYTLFYLASQYTFSQNRTPQHVRSMRRNLKNDIDSLSYFLGVYWGMNAHTGGYENLNYDALIKGIRAVYEKDTALPSIYTIQSYFKHYSETRGYKVYKADNEKFLAKNAKKYGVQELPSGLQYIVLIQGTEPNL